MKSTQSRREFVKNTSLMTGLAALVSWPVISEASETKRVTSKPFKLNYAPHDGMFKNHAGADFIDQIKFMADQGFRSVEDNGLLGRPVEYQERIGKTATR